MTRRSSVHSLAGIIGSGARLTSSASFPSIENREICRRAVCARARARACASRLPFIPGPRLVVFARDALAASRGNASSVPFNDANAVRLLFSAAEYRGLARISPIMPRGIIDVTLAYPAFALWMLDRGLQARACRSLEETYRGNFASTDLAQRR